MLCPKCKREMETGYIHSSKNSIIVWVDKLAPLSLSYWHSDAEPVSEEFKLGTNAVPTHICKHCKLLLGDYSNKK